MTFPINSSSNTPNVPAGSARQAPAPAEAARASMAGDSLSLSGKAAASQPQGARMSPEEASASVKKGGWLIAAGVAGTALAWATGGALTAMAGTALAPAAVILGGVGLALWGAKKVGQGLGAKFDQAIEQRTKAYDEALRGN